MTRTVRAAVASLLAVQIPLSTVQIAGAQSVHFEQYQNPKDETERVFNKLFLAGVKDGLATYNVWMTQKGTQVFCQPPKLAVTTDQAEDIMFRWVKDHPTVNTKGVLVSELLLWGLQATFPCEK